MLNITALPLSDYQRAILAELGVTHWQSRDPNRSASLKDPIASSEAVQQPMTKDKIETDTQVKSPQDALVALKQLKDKVLTLESTDNVLLALSEEDINSVIVSDILMAMGLENKVQKRIAVQQLAEYKDYPLSWQQGVNLTLNNNQLTTVSLDVLQISDTKKQLWQLIQKRENASNNGK